MNMKEPVTIADLASMTGVSPSTVSRVINNSGYVGKKTREKVENIISITGFTPNMAAKSLVTTKTNLVGLLLPTLNNPVYFDILKGVNEAAVEFGYSVVITQRGETLKFLKESLMNLASLNVDGIISTIPEYHDTPPEEYLLPFIRKKHPLVQIGKASADLSIDGVSTNAFDTGFQIGHHLASLGHERVGIIGSQKNLYCHERVEGFKSAYLEAGIGIKYLKYFEADMSKSGGYKAACKIFDHKDQLTALFALNDIMALGAYLAAEDNGVRIPSDISIIGIDGIDIGSLLRPKLSTFVLPTHEMGKELFYLLHSRITGEYSGTARSIEFHGRLFPRGSTLSSKMI